jgi:two-component system sensor histidine kinase YesM
VENAIVHGLEHLGHKGLVTVQGMRCDDEMRFSITDNGAGMEVEKIEEILFGREEDCYANQRIGYYAIRNVKERMTLRYGERGRLEIHSTVGKGTEVVITVPIMG